MLLTFFKAIFEFFNTKLGIIVGCILLALIGLYFVNKHGFNNGIEYQKSIYQEEYNKAVLQQKELQAKLINDAVKIAKQEQETKIIYKDRVVTVEKIIEKYKDCKMQDDDFTDYKKELELLK